MRFALSSLAGVAAAAAMLALAPLAGAEPGKLGAEPFRDVVLRDDSLRLRRADAEFASYPDGDGHAVRIHRGSFSEDTARQIALELGELLHGDEMRRLSVILVTDSEMDSLCGPGVLACYGARSEQMVVSGRESDRPPSRSFVVAHEYGHHLARNRSNAPWRSLDWGTKRWATTERVCPGVRRGRFKPGAYGRRSYYDNPGEAYAEAYAFMHFPDEVDWDWNLPHPTRASYRAIRADVTEPWNGPTLVEREGRIRRAGGRDQVRLRTPLDGRLRVRMVAKRGRNFDLRVLDSRRNVLARSSTGGPREKLKMNVCGPRKLLVQAVSRRGKGNFEIRARRP